MPRESFLSIWWCFTGLAVLVSFSVAFADLILYRARTEIHVAPNGNDWLSDGSSRFPLRTIQRALDYASPGCTILLHPGSYAERVHARKSGTPHSPITLRALKPGTAVITGAMTTHIFRQWFRSTTIKSKNVPIQNHGLMSSTK